jgi:putative NADH-flavin reductase
MPGRLRAALERRFEKRSWAMKIAIVGATGRIGTRLTDEALRRSHTVTAISRKASGLPKREGVTTRSADINDAAALAAAISGNEVAVVSVTFRAMSAEKVLDAVKRAGVPRLLVVGGAGSLEVKPGVALIDTPEFPDAFKPEAGAARDFLKLLKQEPTVSWTFVSPSALIAPGERTGKFRVGKDSLLVAADSRSWISMEDYAIGFLDEIERPAHVRLRFTLGY